MADPSPEIERIVRLAESSLTAWDFSASLAALCRVGSVADGDASDTLLVLAAERLLQRPGRAPTGALREARRDLRLRDAAEAALLSAR